MIIEYLRTKSGVDYPRLEIMMTEEEFSSLLAANPENYFLTCHWRSVQIELRLSQIESYQVKVHPDCEGVVYEFKSKTNQVYIQEHTLAS